jgi:hypothetical protein
MLILPISKEYERWGWAVEDAGAQLERAAVNGLLLRVESVKLPRF